MRLLYNYEYIVNVCAFGVEIHGGWCKDTWSVAPGLVMSNNQKQAPSGAPQQQPRYTQGPYPFI